MIKPSKNMKTIAEMLYSIPEDAEIDEQDTENMFFLPFVPPQLNRDEKVMKELRRKNDDPSIEGLFPSKNDEHIKNRAYLIVTLRNPIPSAKKDPKKNKSETELFDEMMNKALRK